jgi:hypothetical protein
MKSKEQTNLIIGCEKCNGVGWWPIGDLSPIGPMDAREWGNRVISCPFCNSNGVKTGERYELLLKIKQREDTERKVNEKNGK